LAHFDALGKYVLALYVAGLELGPIGTFLTLPSFAIFAQAVVFSASALRSESVLACLDIYIFLRLLVTIIGSKKFIYKRFHSLSFISTK
jgi:hypothetical protein